MIRVPKDKAIRICIPYQMFEETGLLVHEDELWFRANEEQYNRMKVSFDSGKYQKMSEDESLNDLCDLFTKAASKAKWQRFVFDYPTDIKQGITFEDNSSIQWDEEAYQKLYEAISPKLLADEKEEIDKTIEAVYNETLHLEKYLDDIKALNDWMVNKGFEFGEQSLGLTDKTGENVGCLDLAWPFGVYGATRGFTKPIALRIDATKEDLEAAEEQGFTCFTSIEEFKTFVEKNYLRRD